ncbi:MAG TPA: OmpA family protein [Cryomorphaceae bacterium]|nr:OmpA family protein [Cryomorphaceae bacterium]
MTTPGLLANRVQIQHCLLTLFLILAAAGASFGQLKKGQKLFAEGNYQEAIKPLKKDFYGKSGSREAGILLSKCYYQLQEYQEALDVISIVGTETLTESEDIRFYADVLIANDNFSEAFLELISLFSQDQTDAKTALWLDKVSDLLKWDTLPTASDVLPVLGLNSIYNEYAPYIPKAGEMWFVSDVTGVQSVFPNSYSNENMHLYYKTEFAKADGSEVKRPTWLIKNKNYYYHDGPIAKWPGTDKYVMTLRDLDAGPKDPSLELFFSGLQGDEESLIPFKYNENYNTGHATFASNGTRMIFSSNRPGGFGQMDLWYSDWINGTWSPPVNMGPIINTPFNEVFPEMYNTRLFFSSDRSDIGYGSLDIYYASELHGFSEVVNMRSPVNSAYDDFSVAFDSTKSGYFATNRPEGAGGDDIYRFYYDPIPDTLPTTRLRIVGNDIGPRRTAEIRDSDGQLVFTTTTDSRSEVYVEGLKKREIYTLTVIGEKIDEEATLAHLTSGGELVNSFPQISENTFKFSIGSIPKDLMTRQDNEDESIVQYDLDGKIIVDEGVVVEGVPVSLISSRGKLISTVEADNSGKFQFKNATEGEAYTLKTEGLSEYHEIDVYGKQGAITQSLKTLGNNEYSYTRSAPAAKWMSAAEISVPDVIAVIPSMDMVPVEVELFDENDLSLGNRVIRENGQIQMGSLVARKVYRLNVPNLNLEQSDKLFILNSSGDTAQVVRPMDAHNYFFEYLLNSSYGVTEARETVAETAFKGMREDQTNLFKVRIVNYDADKRVPFLLENLQTGETDTVYASNKGILIIRDVNPEDGYKLTIINGELNENAMAEVYDSENNLIYTAPTEDMKSFLIWFLKQEDFALNAMENKEDGILNIELRGRMNAEGDERVKLEIFDQNLEKLGESFVSGVRNFSFQDLPSDSAYIVKSNIEDEDAYLMVAGKFKGDSLKVLRGEDGNFYVRLDAGLDKVTLVENDRKVDVAKGSKFDLNNVYYKFDSYALTEESKTYLNKLVVLMENNPGLEIELRSHTDSRGPANYNLYLSQKRAASVTDYLVAKGISKDRLSPKGVGEQELTNRCADGVKCSIAEHAKNRRTEFVVMGGGD